MKLIGKKRDWIAAGLRCRRRRRILLWAVKRGRSDVIIPAGDIERVKFLKINSLATTEGWDKKDSVKLLTLPLALRGPSGKKEKKKKQLYFLILPEVNLAPLLTHTHTQKNSFAIDQQSILANRHNQNSAAIDLERKTNQSLLVLSKRAWNKATPALYWRGFLKVSADQTLLSRSHCTH